MNDAPPTESPRLRIHRSARADDIDALGHVSNIAYVRWVQDTATVASDAAGWDFARYKALGAVWVVRSHEITYYAPAYDGDAIVCTTWIEGWKGASSPRRTVITRAKDDLKLCECVTLWALMDMTSGRPKRIPPDMLQDFARTPVSGLDFTFDETSVPSAVR